MDQAAKLNKDLRVFQQKTSDLGRRGAPLIATEELLQPLLHQWNQMLEIFSSYDEGKKVIASSPRVSSDGASYTHQNTQNVTSPNLPESPLLRTISNNNEIADYVAKVSKLREAIGAVNRQLHLPELSGKDFEDFSKQEGALKTINDALEALRPHIDSVKLEARGILQKANDNENVQVGRLLDMMSDDWQRVKQLFSDRHG